MSEPYMKWQDELCGLCKHSHQSHGATDGGRCRVRGCLCSKFNEVIERDQAIHELEAVIETLRAQNRELMAALEAMLAPCPPGTHEIGPDGECTTCPIEEQARSVIAQAKGETNA